MSITEFTKKPIIGNPIGSQSKSDQVDKRIRIRCRPGQENVIYGNPTIPTNPMSILHQTNGIIFPFTPSINVKQNASWSSQSLTHSLQDYYYFKTIQSTEISISGRFSAQNHYEGRYLLAVLHFLRSYAKMYFGTAESEEKRGLPPPVLLLDGYGNYIFDSLPVIILDWSFEFPSDVDYVKIIFDNSSGINNQNLSNPVSTLSNTVQSESLINGTFSNINNQNLNQQSSNPNLGILENKILLDIKKLEKAIQETKISRENIIKSGGIPSRELDQRFVQFASEREKLIKLLPPEISDKFSNNNIAAIQNSQSGILTNNPLTQRQSTIVSQSNISSNYNYAYLPTITNISVNLVVQRPPTTLKREFNLQDFREGKLISKKGFI